MTSRVLSSDDEFERIFGGIPSKCQARNEPFKINTSMGRDTFQGSVFVATSTVAASFFIFLSMFW